MSTYTEDTVYPITEPSIQVEPCLGITKREYFAAMAMQGICANPGFELNIIESSVQVADLLIKELNK